MKFQGVFTAIITPFTKDGSQVDYDAYARLLEKQMEAGVAGVVPCGTTGESPTLSHKEHIEVIKKTVEIVKNRALVIAGTGSNSTREAIELTEEACKYGVNAVMLVSPYYNKPTQDGLYRHFKAIAEVSSVPVILYNIKGRTAVNIEPETFVRLSEIPNIVAVKEASGDLNQMAKILHYTKGKIALLSGDDNLIPAVMGIGGVGVISVTSNIYPKRMVRMMDYYLSGQFDKANQMFYELFDFMNAMFWETNPIPVKTAAGILGLCEPTLRLPLSEMSPDKVEKLKEVIKKTGEDQ
ncbi:MAG: 4-hydroxy-tetrahydrodipicolinate synthase [Leptospiraceae bacterium]|nr:4-hydroxy-tetrahydrodipicolinate synthase [Leptospiraceae bacterium]MDW7976629.1 4-hydroxy-tetrahydrodipicolinate synthase [Leptospiraceae bacterium]